MGEVILQQNQNYVTRGILDPRNVRLSQVLLLDHDDDDVVSSGTPASGVKSALLRSVMSGSQETLLGGDTVLTASVRAVCRSVVDVYHN